MLNWRQLMHTFAAKSAAKPKAKPISNVVLRIENHFAYFFQIGVVLGQGHILPCFQTILRSRLRDRPMSLTGAVPHYNYLSKI